MNTLVSLEVNGRDRQVIAPAAKLGTIDHRVVRDPYVPATEQPDRATPTCTAARESAPNDTIQTVVDDYCRGAIGWGGYLHLLLRPPRRHSR